MRIRLVDGFPIPAGPAAKGPEMDERVTVSPRPLPRPRPLGTMFPDSQSHSKSCDTGAVRSFGAVSLCGAAVLVINESSKLELLILRLFFGLRVLAGISFERFRLLSGLSVPEHLLHQP